MPQKRYTVQAPDGRTITLEGPDGASQEDVIAQAQRLLGESSGPDFSDVKSGSSTADGSNTGVVSGIKRGLSSLASAVRHPIDTASAIGNEALNVTRPMAFVKRGQEAMQAARSDEHGGTGLDPYLHGAVASAPFVGQHANEMLTRSATDLPGAAAQAGTEILVPPALKQVAGAAKSAIPSTTRAAAKFDTIDAAARDVPINTALPDEIIARAKELSERGSTMPKVFRDYIRARAKAEAIIDAPSDFKATQSPMTYIEGRDFAKSAGSLSAVEATRLNGPMHRQVTQFYDAMKKVNREAAAKVGLGQQYDEAMKEYAQAMSNQAKVDWLKKWTKRGIAVFTLGRAAGAGMDFPTK